MDEKDLPNPLLRMSEDPDEPGPILELKKRLVLYLDFPPDSATVYQVYELYMARYGRDVAQYRSMAFGDIPEDWTDAARRRFEQKQLPDLYQRMDWGYMFGTDRLSGNRVFMFHGARPASEPGRASILRFDFEWDFDAEDLRQFTALILAKVECVCGSVGYVLVPDEVDSGGSGDALMFAWAMRYWGAEAQDLDISVDHALNGFPCISWLTVVGTSLRGKNQEAVEHARAVAFASFDVDGAVVIQTEERPRLIDRNRREMLGNYPAVAEALLPLQAEGHASFSGDQWDEISTFHYLHRFTDPESM